MMGHKHVGAPASKRTSVSMRSCDRMGKGYTLNVNKYKGFPVSG